MKLKYIPNTICPTCGAGVVAESCRHTHVNGQGFEEREFACGCIIAWVPNYERLQLKKLCPNLPEEKLKQEKRKQARQLLLKFTGTLDVDEQFRKDFLREIERLHN